MEKKVSSLQGSPCVCCLLLVHTILSAEAALQSETKCYNPALLLKAHFRPP